MYGAIIGDIVGSRFEWNNIKTKQFELFHDSCRFTDDTVMTVAIANALEQIEPQDIYNDNMIKQIVICSLKEYGKLYPEVGYGGLFKRWLNSENSEPYNSFGNGSAMRVSQAGWLYDTLYDTERVAQVTASVTHNHEEGLKGAKVVAGCIYLARTVNDKEEIKKYAIKNGYEIKTCDEIRPTYVFNSTCQGTIPQAISAFLEGENFEDVIRTAVSLGGDCDTLTCIAGSIAEAFYNIPDMFKELCCTYLDKHLEIKLKQLNK